MLKTSLLLATLLTAPAPAAAGQRFASTAGRFQVEFPVGRPSENRRIVPSDLGDVELVSVSASNPDDTHAFLVTYVDYPADRVRRRGAEILRSAVDGLVGDDARVRRNEEVKIRRATGREVQFEKGRFFVLARLFLVGNRLYQVVALRPAGIPDDPNMRLFLESFSVDEGGAGAR